MDSVSPTDIFDEIVYVYDGSLEGLLTAVYASYANHENPTDVVADGIIQPRLSQRVSYISTEKDLAERVRLKILSSFGSRTWRAIRTAAVSSQPHTGTALYNFIRYAMDCQGNISCRACRKLSTCAQAHGKGSCPRVHGDILSDMTHPKVEPLITLERSVDNECEHIRQFARFEHLKNDQFDFWFARCNPRDNVIPLVMNHFVERFNVQPFIMYDENHGIAGIYEGRRWYLTPADRASFSPEKLPPQASEEATIQYAWKCFYHCLSIESRYHPELRRQFMPKRLWKNITEMQEIMPGMVPQSLAP